MAADASAELERLVARALAEDVGAGDITSEAVVARRRRGAGADRPEAARRRLRPRRRARGLPAGRGRRVRAPARGGRSGATTCRSRSRPSPGPARALLAGERTALNLLAPPLRDRDADGALRRRGRAAPGRRSSTPARPRRACARSRRPRWPPGAGATTASGLDDAILIKENHVALAGGLTPGRRARPARPPRARGRGRVPRCGRGRGGARGGRRPAPARQHDPRASCARRSPPATPRRRAATLEASGGITLENVAAVAATGVEMISIGALTHSAPALDLSMLLETG